MRKKRSTFLLMVAMLLWSAPSTTASDRGLYNYKKQYFKYLRGKRRKRPYRLQQRILACQDESDCPYRSFCKFEDGDCTATAMGSKRGGMRSPLVGTCEEYNYRCTREYRPVCGCNGHSYPNDCVCLSKGVSVAYQGNC
eukprot:scaffold2346_cov280-Alexandrium_tamarense.AAC.3